MLRISLTMATTNGARGAPAPADLGGRHAVEQSGTALARGGFKSIKHFGWLDHEPWRFARLGLQRQLHQSSRSSSTGGPVLPSSPVVEFAFADAKAKFLHTGITAASL